MLNKNGSLEDSPGKYKSGQKIFIENSPLYIQNMHNQAPGITLPELISIVVLI